MIEFSCAFQEKKPESAKKSKKDENGAEEEDDVDEADEEAEDEEYDLNYGEEVDGEGMLCEHRDFMQDCNFYYPFQTRRKTTPRARMKREKVCTLTSHCVDAITKVFLHLFYLQMMKMKTKINRRNFIFCKCAVTEEILKKKYSKNHKKKHFKKPNNIIMK